MQHDLFALVEAGFDFREVIAQVANGRLLHVTHFSITSGSGQYERMSGVSGGFRNRMTRRTELLRFDGAVERDPRIDAWMKKHAGELGAIAH